MVEVAGIIYFELKWLKKGKIRYLSSLGSELNLDDFLRSNFPLLWSIMLFSSKVNI